MAQPYLHSAVRAIYAVMEKANPACHCDDTGGTLFVGGATNTTTGSAVPPRPHTRAETGSSPDGDMDEKLFNYEIALQQT